jgi:O-acetylserine/cysteine efflux transporter
MRRGHVLLSALVAVLWGVNFVVIDIGLRQFPPLLFAAVRFVFVALPAIAFVPRPPVAWRWLLAVGTLMGVGQFGLLFIGMSLGMPAGLSSLVLQAQAVFTLMFGAALLGERLGWWLVGGTLLASAGITVIGVGSQGAVPVPALLFVVAAAASWGLANVCTRVAAPPPGLGMLVWSSIVPPVPLMGLSLLVEGEQRVVHALTTVDAESLVALAYVVVVATLFCFGTWTSLLGQYAAGTVAPYALLVPVSGMASAWVALGERPGATQLVGSVVVLAGLVVVTWSAARTSGAQGAVEEEAFPTHG